MEIKTTFQYNGQFKIKKKLATLSANEDVAQ